MLSTRLPAETDEYRKRREELRLAEIELIEHRERVAGLRRELPLGPVVDDYVFREGPTDLDAGDEPVSEVPLSGLFTHPGRLVDFVEEAIPEDALRARLAQLCNLSG